MSRGCTLAAKGVSSSAALEVATVQALNATLRLALSGQRVAELAQQVENRVVGAPCGIMDQMASALGRPNELLILRCEPPEVRKALSLNMGDYVTCADVPRRDGRECRGSNV
jgi:galactokinase